MPQPSLNRAAWRDTLYRIIFEADTPAGKSFEIAPVFSIMLSLLVMILGYAIIAVPTGIVTVELARSHARQNVVIACPRCMLEGHAQDARYCRRCGERLLAHDQQVKSGELS